MLPAESVEPTYLRVEVSSALDNGWLSMAHASQGLMILQRLINSAVVQEDFRDTPLEHLTRRERTSLAQLGIERVYTGSAILEALFRYVKDSAILSQLSTTVTTVNTTLTTLLVTALFQKAREIRQGNNPFKPNDSTRTQLEELAAVARRGQVVFTVRLGKEVCVIDTQTADELRKLKKRIRGARDTFTGVVVGSSKRRTFIEITIDAYGADVPCTYKQKQEASFLPLTRVNTAVKLAGIPIWEGREDTSGPPNSIQLDWLKDAAVAASTAKQARLI